MISKVLVLQHFGAQLFIEVAIHAAKMSVQTILICQGCSNKIPQTGGLNNRTLLPQVLEVVKSKVKVLAGLDPSENYERKICSRLGLAESVFILGCNTSLPSVCPLFISTLVMLDQSPPSQSHFNPVASEKTPSPNKITF